MSATPIHKAAVNLAAPAKRDDHAALKKAANQLQAVFLNQLFQAMRASLPKDSESGADGGGEEMFTSMMDERISQLVAPKLSRGVSDALYQQLARRLDAPKEKP